MPKYFICFWHKYCEVIIWNRTWSHYLFWKPKFCTFVTLLGIFLLVTFYSKVTSSCFALLESWFSWHTQLLLQYSVLKLLVMRSAYGKVPQPLHKEIVCLKSQLSLPFFNTQTLEPFLTEINSHHNLFTYNPFHYSHWIQAYIWLPADLVLSELST